MSNFERVEIGCGNTKHEGFFGIDMVSLPGVDLVSDVNKKGIPLPDNVVKHMLFNHSFEHFDDFMFIVGEMWRVCRHYARIEINAPYYTNIVNLSNPYHHIHLTEYTFLFFSDKLVRPPLLKQRLGRGSANEQHGICFRQEDVVFTYFEPWINKTEAEQEFARLHYLHVVENIHIRLRVIKD